MEGRDRRAPHGSGPQLQTHKRQANQRGRLSGQRLRNSARQKRQDEQSLKAKGPSAPMSQPVECPARTPQSSNTARERGVTETVRAVVMGPRTANSTARVVANSSIGRRKGRGLRASELNQLQKATLCGWMLAFTGQVAADGWTKTFGLVESRNRASESSAFRAAKLATPQRPGVRPQTTMPTAARRRATSSWLPS